jgi:DNA repair exonuclease SbcCD ATPase subunit
LLKLININIKNFRSYPNRVTKFDFDNNILTIISGINGSGKTTLLYALLYALYGKVHKIKLEDIVSDKGGSLLVVLNFESNGVLYRIERGLKPKVFNIYKDNILLPINSIKDQQKWLEDNILGISYNLFLKLIMINSTIFTKNFVTATASERRDFLEEILTLDLLSTVTKYIKDKIKLNSTKSTDINYQLDSVKNNLSNQDILINQLKDQYKQELEDYKDIKSISKTISELDKKLSKFKPHPLKEIQESNEKYLKLKSLLQSSETKLHDYKESEIINNIDEFKKSQSLLLKDIDYIKNSRGSYKRDCDLLIELKSKNEQLLKIDNIDIDSNITELDRLLKDKVKLESRLNWFKDNRIVLTNMKKELDNSRIKLVSLNNKLIELKGSDSFIKQYSVCQGCEKLSQISTMLKDGEVLDDFITRVKLEKESIDSDIVKVNKTIKELEDKISKLSKKLDRELQFKEAMLELDNSIKLLEKSIKDSKLAKKDLEANTKLIDECKKRLKSYNRELLDSETDIKNSYIENRSKLNDLEKILQSFKELSKIKIDLSKLKYQNIDKLIEENRLYENNTLLKERLEKKVNILKSIDNKLKVIDTTIKQYKLDIKNLNRELMKLTKDLKSYERIKNVCENEEVKERVFSQYIPHFNKQVNRYLNEFNVPFQLELDKLFNFNFIKRGRPVSYSTFSKGEEVRVNLAIILSFVKIIELRNLFKINFLAFDEVDGVLDTENLNAVIELLAQLKDRKILFITHRNDLNIDERYSFELLKVSKSKNGYTEMSIY